MCSSTVDLGQDSLCQEIGAIQSQSQDDRLECSANVLKKRAVSFHRFSSDAVYAPFCKARTASEDLSAFRNGAAPWSNDVFLP